MGTCHSPPVSLSLLPTHHPSSPEPTLPQALLRASLHPSLPSPATLNPHPGDQQEFPKPSPKPTPVTPAQFIEHKPFRRLQDLPPRDTSAFCIIAIRISFHYSIMVEDFYMLISNPRVHTTHTEWIWPPVDPTKLPPFVDIAFSAPALGQHAPMCACTASHLDMKAAVWLAGVDLRVKVAMGLRHPCRHSAGSAHFRYPAPAC